MRVRLRVWPRVGPGWCRDLGARRATLPSWQECPCRGGTRGQDGGASARERVVQPARLVRSCEEVAWKELAHLRTWGWPALEWGPSCAVGSQQCLRAPQLEASSTPS